MAWGAPKGIKDLVERVQRNDASLTSLCLFRGRRFEEGDALELCDALAVNTVLRELSIASHAVGPAAAAAFARALATNTALCSLDLGNSSFGDEGLAALAPGIAASASLRQLNLERKGITAAGCAALAAALAGFSGSSGSRLEELLLGQNGLGAEGLAALLEGLTDGGGASLRSLDLSACGLEGTEGMQALAAALQQGRLPRLGTLRLDGNGLGAGGATALAAALGGTSASSGGSGSASLAQLHLQSCGLDGEAAAALAAGLPHSLATLDLSGNSGMGAHGTAALAAALAAGGAPHLRKLLLCGCGLEDCSIAALAEALARRPVPAGTSKAAAGEVAAAAGTAGTAAGTAGLALDLSGNSAGAAAVAALSAAPLSSLCLHDCKLGGSGAAGEAGEAAAAAAAAGAGAAEAEAGDAAAAMQAVLASLAAPGAFLCLRELDISGNRLAAPQLLALLAALTPADVSSGGGGSDSNGSPIAPCPQLRLLVIAANPGASDEPVSEAVERLQEARPGMDVVRRAADTGEGGMMAK